MHMGGPAPDAIVAFAHTRTSCSLNRQYTRVCGGLTVWCTVYKRNSARARDLNGRGCSVQCISARYRECLAQTCRNVNSL